MAMRLYEENSELKRKRFPLTKGIRKHLKSTLDGYDGDKAHPGYKRLKNLLKAEKGVTYFDMKRIKNFFDTYVGTKKSTEWLLNGGDDMRWWVENTLGTARKQLDDEKRTKKDSGRENVYKRSHSKRQIRKNKPTGVKFKTTNRNVLKNQTLRYEESIFRTDNNRINESKMTNDTHFAVNKKTGLIVFGWDYSDYDREDLRHFRYDYFTVDLENNDFNPKEYTILTRKECLRRGIDPDNQGEFWSNRGDISLNDERKTEESLRRHITRIVENLLTDWQEDGDGTPKECGCTKCSPKYLTNREKITH